MSALATWMMKGKIDKAQIPTLPDLIDMAKLEGVELVACKMTFDMMELKQDDFVEGVTIESAEDFMKYAIDCRICLFT
jgi:predicted peroxiredoxin